MEGEQPGTSDQYFSQFMWSSKLRCLLLNRGPLQHSHWQRLHLIKDSRASKSAHEKPSLKQHLSFVCEMVQPYVRKGSGLVG